MTNWTSPQPKTTDESWPMIEEAVFRLFAEAATAAAPRGQGRITIGPRLAELGWAEIEAEYPVEACELLFRAHGRSLAHTECLDRVMLLELASLLNGPANAVMLPDSAYGCAPGTDTAHLSGIVLGPLEGRVVVPVRRRTRAVSIGVIDADRLHGERMNTFDPSLHWTKVSGLFDGETAAASNEWTRAIAAAHRALATELIAIADEVLRIAVEHARIRVQFGSPIGSFQSPRHALAETSAQLDGARALLGESWRYGGQLSAWAAKAAAGRAHRVVSDTAMQVCGAIGLTAEHDLHHYIVRGFQLDSLCGSHRQLEAMVGEHLFDTLPVGAALPAIVSTN